MVRSSYQASLAAYREGTALATRPGAALEETDVERASDDALIASQELENVLSQDLASGDQDVRDLAAVQLSGGAALDFAAAADLLAQVQATGVALEGTASLFEQTYTELRSVMEAEPALGARDVADGTSHAALEEGEPIAVLRMAATNAIDSIAKDAEQITAGALGGIRAMPADALMGAVARSAETLIGPLYHQLGRIVRRALRFLAKGLSKILRMLGPFEDKARAKLREWLGEFVEEKLAAFAVGIALEIERLKKDVQSLVGGASADLDPKRLEVASAEVAELAARFKRHGKVLGIVTKVLGKIRGYLMSLGHWGIVAIAGIYLTVLAYGIWVGGDFLDWYRTKDDGLLDLVNGVRSTIAAAVGTQPA